MQLEYTDDPVPGEGEVLIRVEAGNINFAEILLCQGIYQDRPGVPFTPGLETSGIVDAAGPGVEITAGTRIAGLSALPAGGYAEKALIRGWTALEMPLDIPAADATVLYSTYQTAHVGLHHRGCLQEGEWLLVHGGAGGVGSAAVQLGAAAGARVIATAGGAAKVEACRDFGAHHAIDYASADVYDEVMNITDGRGVDVAFDPVGGPVGETTRRLMAWEGRLVVIGFASGDIPSFPGNHILVKNYSVVGLHWGAYSPTFVEAGWLFEADTDQQQVFHTSLLDALAAIHAVELDELGDLAESGATDSNRVALVELSEIWTFDQGSTRPSIVDHALGVLAAVVPGPTSDCLLWGDARPANVITDPVTFRPAALVDWELATVGSPERDLMWLMEMNWMRAQGAGLAPLSGFLTDQQSIEHYAQRTGRDIRHLDWYRGFAAARVAVFMHRYLRAQVHAGRLDEGHRVLGANVASRRLEVLLS